MHISRVRSLPLQALEGHPAKSVVQALACVMAAILLAQLIVLFLQNLPQEPEMQEPSVSELQLEFPDLRDVMPQQVGGIPHLTHAVMRLGPRALMARELRRVRVFEI